MLEALCDPLFLPLLDHQVAAAAAASAAGVGGDVRPGSVESVSSGGSGRSSPRGFSRSQSGNPVVTYAHYYRSAEQGGIEGLPLV